MRETSAVMLALGAEDYAFVIPNPEQQARIAMLRNKVRVEFDFPAGKVRRCGTQRQEVASTRIAPSARWTILLSRGSCVLPI